MTAPITRFKLDIQMLDNRDLPTVGLVNCGSFLNCAPAVHVGQPCVGGPKGDLKQDQNCQPKVDTKCAPAPVTPPCVPAPKCGTPTTPPKGDDGKCDLFHGWNPCDQASGGKQGSGKHSGSHQKSGSMPKCDPLPPCVPASNGQKDNKGKDDCGINHPKPKDHACDVVAALCGVVGKGKK